MKCHILQLRNGYEMTATLFIYLTQWKGRIPEVIPIEGIRPQPDVIDWESLLMREESRSTRRKTLRVRLRSTETKPTCDPRPRLNLGHRRGRRTTKQRSVRKIIPLRAATWAAAKEAWKKYRLERDTIPNPIRPCHTAAILSRETKKALFYHAKPRREIMGVRLGVVKQSFFGLPGQYGRRVTRANRPSSKNQYSGMVTRLYGQTWPRSIYQYSHMATRLYG